MFLNPSGHLGLDPLLHVMHRGVGDAWLWALFCPPSAEPCPSWLWHWGLHPHDGECAQMGVGTEGLEPLQSLGQVHHFHNCPCGVVPGSGGLTGRSQ